jgi:hypothetical protein
LGKRGAFYEKQESIYYLIALMACLFIFVSCIVEVEEDMVDESFADMQKMVYEHNGVQIPNITGITVMKVSGENYVTFTLDGDISESNYQKILEAFTSTLGAQTEGYPTDDDSDTVNNWESAQMTLLKGELRRININIF